MSSLSFPSAIVAAPATETVPALHVEMPDFFRLEMAPPHPLSIGNALTVRVKRTHGSARKSDWNFSFGPKGWQRTQDPLSDDEIRQCLTPGGPRAVA
jgi:hypothetical protein